MGPKQGKWDEHDMKLAINKVRNKEISIKEASDSDPVSGSTLGDIESS